MVESLSWQEKLTIFGEVLLTYRRLTRPGRKGALELWRLRKNIEQMQRCPECGEPAQCTGEWSGLGECFANWECTHCSKEWIENLSEHDGECPACGQRLPVVDADESGPSYGRCRTLACVA